MRAHFEGQTKLLLEVLGIVMQNPSYALKGGTAINFFQTNLPRLSVDIDLSYTKINSREDFLKENEKFHLELSAEITQKKLLLTQVKRTNEGVAKQITVSSKDYGIKIETNLVLRGSVYPPVISESCEQININYATQMAIRTLSFEDLYAGKFCAALDRQHPRDLFDVMVFFQKHKITEKLKIAFLVYLISSNRPISEMINPNRLNQKQAFSNEFMGMSDYEISYEQLEAARDLLIKNIDAALGQEDRQFLISFKEGNPNWQHFHLEHIKDLPAVKWKLHNILKMSQSKRNDSLVELRRKLGL